MCVRVQPRTPGFGSHRGLFPRSPRRFFGVVARFFFAACLAVGVSYFRLKCHYTPYCKKITEKNEIFCICREIGLKNGKTHLDGGRFFVYNTE
jgi:hypothetical protein